MKKLISLASAVVLVFALAVSAFAAAGSKNETLTALNSSSSQDVTAKAVDKNGNDLKDSDTTAVYSIKVSFDTMHFAFESSVESGSLTWDAENGKYSNLAGSWKKGTMDFTVTNASNRPVSATATFKNAKALTASAKGVTAVISSASKVLKAASDVKATASDLIWENKVTVSGTPYVFGDITVDTVVVTIEGVN